MRVKGVGTMKEQRVVKTVSGHEEAMGLLKELSEDGQAWSYFVMPFSTEVHFVSAKSPCKVKDEYLSSSGNRIGWKGEIVGFTPSAHARENRRAFGRD
jgi:hypothetical protein